MKHIKSFKLYENEDLSDFTRDVFDLWNEIKLTGYAAVTWPSEIKWDLGDELDRPDDHEVVYYAEGVDNDGFKWETTASVVDGLGPDIEYDYMELDSSSADRIIVDYLIPLIKKLGHSSNYKENKKCIRTTAMWEDFVSMFRKIEENDEEIQNGNAMRIHLFFESKEGNEIKILFKKFADGDFYFSLY